MLRHCCRTARRCVLAAARLTSGRGRPVASAGAQQHPGGKVVSRAGASGLLHSHGARRHATGVAATGAAAPPGSPPVPDALPETCPGCGVHLQTGDPEKPGFVQVPKRLVEPAPGAAAVEAPVESPPASLSFAVVTEEDAQLRAGPLAPPAEYAAKQVVCARCYALQHYGRVKSVAADALLPGFDFDAMVGSKLRKAATRTRPVVVLVVDLADFDGSFPAVAAKSLTAIGDSLHIILACTKADLLPRSSSPARLDQWVRARAKQGGLAAPLTAVQLIGSPVKYGVSSLAVCLEELAASRSGAEVWVVGAQNAGKSTLINALAAHYYGSGFAAGPVASHVAGTTVGLVRLDSLLPGKRTVVDTPGLVQNHQLATRLSPDDARLVLPRKPLRPRSFRAPVGSTVSAGALFRVDVVDCNAGETVYLTLWVSADVRTHMGKTDGAPALLDKHAGGSLAPPVGEEWADSAHREERLGAWVPRTVVVKGTSWGASSCDVAVAGVGWVGVGLDGEATLRVWTYDGVAVTQRSPPLVPDLARQLETPGFDFEQSGKSASGREAKGKGTRRMR